MTLLADWQIRDLVKAEDMISPFVEVLVEKGVISYGLGTAGYDIRVSDEYKIFTNLKTALVDPKEFSLNSFIDHRGPYCIIPPNSFALARSLEYIKMPRWVTGVMTTRSTYARCGLISPCTVLEAGWEGHITIEISNTTPLPGKIYSNEGIAQILFCAHTAPDVSYADRKGKYQGQTGITLPKVRD
jgi:dCTP deaminase